MSKKPSPVMKSLWQLIQSLFELIKSSIKYQAAKQAEARNQNEHTTEVMPPSGPREQLRELQFAQIERVGVLSQRDEDVRDVCAAGDGDVYSVEEAIEKQILPHEHCKNEECRCSYRPKL